ncbi:peptidase domain-containing ABC transporter [Rheinheimera sp. F8]|uniref:peptidase domain-containing ABC transporter n=1 Tax=Rheinheimera sp. F8 TaxID=1763998 RepID=UPI000744BB99|nr:peptidase domain-containing ABC transporter [Rheinheimera sp. F8]ALZ77224.1 ABC transporter ATP-binding protein [Rheinheimera sp. F8]
MSQLASQLKLWPAQRLPVLLQSEAAECGIACLGMVAGFYGHHLNIQQLRAEFGSSIAGCTMKDLVEFASRLALSGRALKLQPEALSKLQLPAILHWDMNHFVVLKSVRRGKLVIHDPARGERTLSLAEVSEHFTGVALELLPTQDFSQRPAEAGLRLRDFWSNISGLKRSVALILSLSLLLQLFTLVAPYYLQLVVDDVLLSADRSLLLVLALGFGLLLLFEISTSVLRAFVLLHFNSAMNIQMAANLLHHLIRLPLSYFEKRQIGDVLSRFGSLQQVRELLTSGVMEAVIDGLMAVAILAVLLWYSPLLCLIVLMALLCYGIVQLLMYHQYRKVSEQQIVAQAQVQSHQIETVRAMQTLKLFSAEAKREASWQHLYVVAANRGIQLGVFNLSFQHINKLLTGIEHVLVIYFGALLVLDGGFSTGMLFAFIAYKSQFMERMSRLIDKGLALKMLNLHFARLADIVATPREDKQGGVAQREIVLSGQISVDNLSFAYSSTGALVLQQISLDVAAGESVAVVGPSGCGKTTLLKLMLGLFTPQQGEVRVDGVPLSQLSLACYRNQIAAVMQDDQLLSGSIRDNICFFADEPDDDWAQQCAKLAAVHDDISRMPMAYHSLIGDMGSALSGGQKQRILLARALYRRPKILFLDEATSHLDMATEAVVSSALQQLQITRIIIAHRPETIASADRVLTLPALQQGVGR